MRAPEAHLYVQRWMQDRAHGQHGNLLIIGDHGIGKNSVVNSVLKANGLKRINLYGHNFKAAGFVQDILRSTPTDGRTTVSSLVSPHKKAYVINSVHAVSLANEKENILALIRANNAQRLCPIVLIGGPQHSKFILTLRKLCDFVHIAKPDADDMAQIAYDEGLRRRLKMASPCLYARLATLSCGDVRQLCHILDELDSTFGSDCIIDAEQLTRFEQNRATKNINQGIYASTRKLLDNLLSVDEVLELYETEKVLLPLTVYENYYKNVAARELPPEQQASLLHEVLDSLSVADVVESCIYNDQNWGLQTVHGFFSCVQVSRILNAPGIPTVVAPYPVEFSCDLNKTSLRNINKKHIIGLTSALGKTVTAEDTWFLGALVAQTRDKAALDAVKRRYGLTTKNVDTLRKLGRLMST